MTNEPFCPALALGGKHGVYQHSRAAGSDFGAAEEPPTLDRVVARAQALSRNMVVGKAGASVEDFLADRANEAARQ
jgi:hypothetical protein